MKRSYAAAGTEKVIAQVYRRPVPLSSGLRRRRVVDRRVALPEPDLRVRCRGEEAVAVRVLGILVGRLAVDDEADLLGAVGDLDPVQRAVAVGALEGLGLRPVG